MIKKNANKGLKTITHTFRLPNRLFGVISQKYPLNHEAKAIASFPNAAAEPVYNPDNAKYFT